MNSTPEPLYATFMNESEWKSFSERNQEFVKHFPNLTKAMNIAFVRDHTGSQLDTILLSLGRLCLEEFMEILLLCGHGYGVAATRLVRGMYERAVTAEYLHDHPDEVDAFVNYSHVAAHKLLVQIRETMGTEMISPKITQEIEENYQKHKNEFWVTNCKECGTQRINHNWSKLDFVAMARKTSLWKMIVTAYYLPTREIHSTFGAISTRAELDENDQVVFTGDAQHKNSDTALMTAHNIMLFVLELQKNHFNMQELEEPFQTCLQDFTTIWAKK